MDKEMSCPEKITHTDLCIETAKRFIKWVALYEYKSFASIQEQPDVLILNEGNSMLFEIKMSMTDFNADQHKECRKKYITQYWAQQIYWGLDIKTEFLEHITLEQMNKNPKIAHLKLKTGKIEIELIEREHLGNKRYYVCPYGVIPVDKLPEGWGLYYYRKGKFYLKKESGKFRSNLRVENNLALHAMRRVASGDSTGVMISSYQFDPRRKERNKNIDKVSEPMANIPRRTRRMIIYYDNSNYWSTCEFIGDKWQLEMTGNGDSCKKDWSEIVKEFDNINSLSDFTAASKRARAYYDTVIRIDRKPPITRTEFNQVGAKEIGKNLWLVEE
jgi:hypothetical protein